MHFRPRQYILIAVIVGLGAFNYVRRHRAPQQLASSANPKAMARGVAPAWAVFDAASVLRDGSDEQFQPALKALNDSIDGAHSAAVPPPANPGEMTDLHGCRTWLLFYRQEHLHPSSRAGWLTQLQNHVASCVANHADIAQ